MFWSLFNVADVSIFLQKISDFCPIKYLSSKQYCQSCVRDFLVLFPVFFRQKITITENITLAGSVSGIRPLDCSKLAKNPKNENGVTIFRHDVNVKFFWRYFVFLVKFSYWSMIHVNIITGSEIIRDWPEIRKSEIPSSEFCPISGDWCELWIPNLVRMSLIKCS